MIAPIRHGRERDSVLWPLIPGVLIGMVIGIVVFSRIVEALR